MPKRGGLETGRPDRILAADSRTCWISWRRATLSSRTCACSSPSQLGWAKVVREQKCPQNKEKGRRDERAATKRVW